MTENRNKILIMVNMEIQFHQKWPKEFVFLRAYNNN